MTENGSIQPTMQPPASGVTVRMYNPGFGDCFLLAFRAQDGTARYMLLDCGVHQDWPNCEVRMGKVVRDIAAATGNHLHLVALTHQHTDHVYGFKYGRDAFDQIDIDDLWLAWTEDPTDPVAVALKQQYGVHLRALGAALQLLPADNALAAALKPVLDFELREGLAAAGGTAGQLDYVRSKSKKKLQRQDDYRRPGEPPLTLPGVEGIKVFVLGPPRETKYIRQESSQKEMYPELAAADGSFAFTSAVLAAVPGASPGDLEQAAASQPFDQSYAIPKDRVLTSPYAQFFSTYYGFSDAAGQGPDWRRIDTDWLNTADQLALDLNSKTNNTSLVLAIALRAADGAAGKPAKILLFAADAQVGNWLSWKEVSWPGEGPGGAKLNALDLLPSVVLYKVGHHGSRNATLSIKGLEKMTNSSLVAMIPVDEEWARTVEHWEHPAGSVLEHLETRTGGRILRSDRIPAGDTLPRPDTASEFDWQAFACQVDWDRSPDRLWIQFTVPF